MFTSIDMFAGCGGLSIGMGSAGIRNIAAVESWQPAANAFSLNHPKSNIYSIDVREFVSSVQGKASGFPKKKDVDIMIGGPPCQGFCGINRYRNINDPRNSLFEVYLDCVAALMPKAVVIENVNGILSLNKGKAIIEALQYLNELGYAADFRVLQAGSYGVPQNRWRVFLIAVQGVTQIIFPRQLHAFHRTVAFDVSKYKERVLYPKADSDDLVVDLLPEINVHDAIADLPDINNGDSYQGRYTKKTSGAYSSMLRGNEKEVSDHECINLGPVSMERVVCLRPDSGDGWTSLPAHLQPKNLVRFGGNRFGNRFARLEWKGGFSTILTKPEPYWGRVIHPRQNRLISVRESARAQGFPDSVKFSGLLRDKYKMVGNAVPPPLGRCVGWALRKTLGDKSVDAEIQDYGIKFKP